METVIEKVRRKYEEKGVVGILEGVHNRFSHAVNFHMLYEDQKKYPIQDNLIILESDGDMTDNAFALFDYMLHHGYLEKYHVIWAVDHLEEAQKHRYPNTEYIQKFPNSIDSAWAKAFATCKWFIYDHCNIMAMFFKRKEQKLIYLSHGTGFKAHTDYGIVKTHCDNITVTGPLAAKIMAEFWSEPIEKTIITGYPRLDYFYSDNTDVYQKVCDRWHFDQYDKVVYWMPTFRQSMIKDLSEDYLLNETGLPLFETRKDLQEISDFLKENHILMVFKLHHLQADLPVFKNHFDNILLVRDSDLQKMGIQVYQFITFADALITDYSSVYTDYLLLDRPVVFTLDDYDQYDKSRGLFPKNAIDYMKGYHVYNKKELEDSLLEIKHGIDRYKEDRKMVIDEFQTFKDGQSAARVLQALHINK